MVGVLEGELNFTFYVYMLYAVCFDLIPSNLISYGHSKQKTRRVKVDYVLELQIMTILIVD